MRQRNRSLSDFGLLEEIKTEPRPGFRTADQILLERLREQKRKYEGKPTPKILEEMDRDLSEITNITRRGKPRKAKN